MTKMEYKKALSSYPEALTASEVAEILREIGRAHF